MNNNNSKTVNLVRGGEDFLCSHLIDRLMGKGEEVICIDNFFIVTKNI